MCNIINVSILHTYNPYITSNNTFVFITNTSINLNINKLTYIIHTYIHTISDISPPALRSAFALTNLSLSREWKCRLSSLHVIVLSSSHLLAFAYYQLTTIYTTPPRISPHIQSHLSKTYPSCVSFPLWASVLVSLFPGTFQIFVSKQRIYLPCSKKSIIIPPTQYFTYPSFFNTMVYLSLRLSITSLVNKKKSPIQYQNMCIIYPYLYQH